jgi:hypothetical protein
VSVIGLSAFLLSLLAADAKPTAKVPVSKETTHVIGPLDVFGFVDYEAALNNRLGKGITPEKNANVLLWKAFGPRPDGARMPAEYFRRLGIVEPPKKGDYMISSGAFVRDYLKLPRAGYEVFWDQQARTGLRPWTAKDYPNIAAWLKVNEKPLNLIVEATKRPAYFNPLVSRPAEKGPGALVLALMPTVQKCRETVCLLTSRAMLKLAQGKTDEAWQDLLAAHRLARQLARGATLIEMLVGIAIDAIACNADLAYLDRGKLLRKQLLACLKDLRDLPPMPPVADKFALAERFFFLDSVQVALVDGVSAVERLVRGGRARLPNAKERELLAMIDWRPAFRDGNRWFDRLVTALRHSDRATRMMAYEEIEAEWKALKAEAGEGEDALRALIAKLRPEEPPDAKVAAEVGGKVGRLLVALAFPVVGKVQNAHDRCEQLQRNVWVAFALAAYRIDHGHYPAKLDEIAPRYLKSVPGDIFSGKALIYRPSEKGYLFYSIGANGKDEGGRWYDDDPPGDDPRVRMPLPELKQKKKQGQQ